MTYTRRIGFACKFLDNPQQIQGIKAKDNCKIYNTGSTTNAWLSKQSKSVAEQKLWDLMVSNIESVHQLVDRVSQYDPGQRMVRISSDILPMYTHESWKYFWKQQDVENYCSRAFSKIGDIAKGNDVRMSMHPGQFVIIASDNPDVVDRSIEEFEYHTSMARWMGYGKKFQDFKINIHIGGRLGPAGIRQSYSRLSPEARNCITLENEENSWGLESTLELADIIPTVLDIHHYWVREGKYIQCQSDQVKRILDSWRGVRPTMHFSTSREDYLVDHCTKTVPDRDKLIQMGYTKQKLRAHSDFYWNSALNDYALEFWENFDIMCESKSKNLGSTELYNYATSAN